jgi:hypothetical protein
MPVAITEIHPAPEESPDALNSEWFVVENGGATPFQAKGCSVAISMRGGRPREVDKLNPGFVLQPGQKVRVVVGSPATKAHGAPPDAVAGGLPNYYLLRRGTMLAGSGSTVYLILRNHEICHATWEGDGHTESVPAAGAEASTAAPATIPASARPEPAKKPEPTGPAVRPKKGKA